MKIEGRSYGLGERNPATLPDGTSATEGFVENAERTEFWKSLRLKTQSGVLTGEKYV